MNFSIKKSKMKKEFTIAMIVLILIIGGFLFFIKTKLDNGITGHVIDSGGGITGGAAISNDQPASPPATQQDRPQDNAKEHIVEIKVFKFLPEELRIRVGDSVTWINYDKAKHKVYTGIHGDGSVLIDSGFMPKGTSYTHVFNEAGIYEYWSAPWPYVRGKVIVEQPTRS
jgi:plastocyanin